MFTVYAGMTELALFKLSCKSSGSNLWKQDFNACRT